MITGTIPLESYAELNQKQICQTKTIKQLFHGLVKGKPTVKEESVDVVFCTSPPSAMQKVGCNMTQSGTIYWFDRFQNNTKIMPDLQNTLERVTGGTVCMIIVLPHVAWDVEDIRGEYDLEVELSKRIMLDKKNIEKVLVDNGAIDIFGHDILGLEIVSSLPVTANIANIAMMDEISFIYADRKVTSYDKTIDTTIKVEPVLQDIHDAYPDVELYNLRFFLDGQGNPSDYLRPYQAIENIELQNIKKENIYVGNIIHVNPPDFSPDSIIKQWKQQELTYKSNSELDLERNTKIAYIQQKILSILEKENSVIGTVADNYIEANVPIHLIPKLVTLDEVILLDVYSHKPMISVPTSGYIISPQLQGVIEAGFEKISVSIDYIPLTLSSNQNEESKKLNKQQSVMEFLEKNNLTDDHFDYFHYDHSVSTTIPVELIPFLEDLKNISTIDVASHGLIRITSVGNNDSTPSYSSLVKPISKVSSEYDTQQEASVNITMSDKTVQIEIIGNKINSVKFPEEAIGKEIKIIYNEKTIDDFEIVKQDNDALVILWTLDGLENTKNRLFMSPKQQSKIGIMPEDISCKSEYVLLIRNNGNPACVTTKTFEKISQRLNDFN